MAAEPKTYQIQDDKNLCWNESKQWKQARQKAKEITWSKWNASAEKIMDFVQLNWQMSAAAGRSWSQKEKIHR